jgi:hypothetical protein
MDSKKNENIVAYLDGELTEEQAADVDRLLSADGDVRQQVEQYSRAWDMLDLLPSSQASDKFAQRTLTAIRSGQADTIEEQGSEPIDQTLDSRFSGLARLIAIRTAAFIGLFLVGLLGFNSNFGQGAEPIDQLLRDLPLLERFEEYREVESIDFLRELDRTGAFRESH